MASPGNPNQPVGPFDMHKFFKPSTSPIPPNPSTYLSSYSPPPSASYPPPTGPYSYSPQTPQFHHPQYHTPSYPPPQDHHVTNLHHQRSISYPTPPLQPPPTRTRMPGQGSWPY
ncbi:hypothetical protein Acr_23g0010700 [Actinidia rufa]|uniref:Uncharacterized protein n=1 Tax=Actinidia rufa TaxID=165716 RepID=A0A7J0GPE8_9ERIC|nr:hypothetical protein Acr_23g0010700 [Actinidia rufa]